MAQPDGSSPVPPRHVPGALDGDLLRRWVSLAEAVAAEVRDLVDSLNVFPVPDADTGTNVLLTLRSAGDALARLPRAADAAQAARAAADGAVRGARGNSGLLISQALASLADICAEAPDPSRLRPVELVSAYERMASTTWAAMSRPVSGTLLTVARDAATAARAALRESRAESPASLSSIASAAAFGAQESVVETAGLGHGPVDAGGAAFMLLLTCLSDAIETCGAGDAAQESLEVRAPYTAVARQMLTDLAAGGLLHSGAPAGGPGAAGAVSGEFEVMYLLEATSAQAEQLRLELERVGDSVGVVGTPDALGVGLYQVHVHTDAPRSALPRQGRARQICIHHLHPTALVLDADEPPPPWITASSEAAGHVVSFERLAARRAERKARSVRMHPSQAGRPRPVHAGAAPAHPSHPGGARGSGRTAPARDQGIGVIACTRAPGLIEQLARSGAVVVLEPDRDGIVRAAGDLGARQVIVLPCDAACTEAAHEAARALAARSAAASPRHPVPAPRSAGGPAPAHSEGIQLLVCDTDDEARVLAAAIAVAGHGQDTEVAELVRRAWRAAARLRTISLSGAEAEPDAVASTIASLLRPDDELLTVITGRGASRDVGALAAGAVGAATGIFETDAGGIEPSGELEVAIHAGGQASPDVLIAIE